MYHIVLCDLLNCLLSFAMAAHLFTKSSNHTDVLPLILRPQPSPQLCQSFGDLDSFSPILSWDAGFLSQVEGQAILYIFVVYSSLQCRSYYCSLCVLLSLFSKYYFPIRALKYFLLVNSDASLSNVLAINILNSYKPYNVSLVIRIKLLLHIYTKRYKNVFLLFQRSLATPWSQNL